MTALCPKCHADSGVLDSRMKQHGIIRRRRQCEDCKYRWSTVEVLVSETKFYNASHVANIERALETAQAHLTQLKNDAI